MTASNSLLEMVPRLTCYGACDPCEVKDGWVDERLKALETEALLRLLRSLKSFLSVCD